jgi:hypothetical protein
MKTKLKQIRSMARDDPTLVFHSIYHLVADVDHLRDCFHRLKASKATGVDRQSKQNYGENLGRKTSRISVSVYCGAAIGRNPRDAPGSENQGSKKSALWPSVVSRTRSFNEGCAMSWERSSSPRSFRVATATGRA